MSKKKRRDVEDTPLTLDILNDPEKLKNFLGGAYVEKGTRKRVEKSDKKAEETVQSFMTELENSAKELDADPVIISQSMADSVPTIKISEPEQPLKMTDGIELGIPDDADESSKEDASDLREPLEQDTTSRFIYDNPEALADEEAVQDAVDSLKPFPDHSHPSDEDYNDEPILSNQPIVPHKMFEIANGRIWVSDPFMGSRTFPLDCDEEMFHGHLDAELLGEFAHLVLKHIVINSFPDLITTKGGCKPFEEDGIIRANGQRILVKYTLFNSDEDLVLGFNLTDDVIDSYSQMLEDLINLSIDDEEIVNILLNMVISYSENNFMSQVTDSEWATFKAIDGFTDIDTFESALIDASKEEDAAIDTGESIYISSSYFEERISEILGIDIDEERGVDHDHDPFLNTDAAATSESTGDENAEGSEQSSGSSDEVEEETQEEKEEESDDEVDQDELEAAFQELQEGE